MINDLVPVTPGWLTAALKAFVGAHSNRLKLEQAQYVTRMTDRLTRRRLWGLLPPIFDHMPSVEEIHEYGEKHMDCWPYHKSEMARLEEFASVIKHMTDAAARDSDIYLTPKTIEMISDHKKFRGFYL